MKFRLLPWLATATFGAAGLLYAAASLRFAYAMTHPPRERITDADRQRARRILPNMVDISFKAADNVVLRGWYVPPRNGIVIVFVPGLASNRTGLMPEAELLAHLGYGAVLFDPRAHGESDGRVATWGWLESDDTKRAVAFVKERPEVQRVVLLGFSVGASTAALAAADNPQVDAVILYAVWTSLEEEIRDKTKHRGPPAAVLARWGYEWFGADVLRVRPIDLVARISPRPLLMVAGTSDEDTPLPIMRRVFAAAREPKELWVVPGLGHGRHVARNPESYAKHVGGFLRRAFGAR